MPTLLANPPPPWLAPYEPALIVGWAAVVFFILSRVGWHGLARARRARGNRPAGTTYWFCRGEVGPLLVYVNTLNVTLAREGIHVATLPPFRLFHPPLLLRWEDVRSVTSARGWFGPTLRVEFEAGGVAGCLFLPVSGRDHIREAVGEEHLAALDQPPPLPP